MQEDLNLLIGRNLSLLRKHKGLTQGEIAMRFNYSDKAISKWEKGESLPDIIVLKELADFYGVSVDYLLAHHDEEELAMAAKHPPKSILKERWIITMLGICTVISIFCIAEVILRINLLSSWNSFQLYFWMAVATLFTLFVFARKWSWKVVSVISSILFVWMLAVAVYLELGYDLGERGWECWFILLSPIPVTIGVILAKGLKMDAQSNQ